MLPHTQPAPLLHTVTYGAHELMAHRSNARDQRPLAVESLAKRLERRLRSVVFALLGIRPRKRMQPSALRDVKKILLLRPDRIGDAVISTPAIKLLREKHPAARIDLLLGQKNKAVAKLIPGVDNVIVLRRSAGGIVRTLSAIRRTRYDVVINLLAKDSAGAALITRVSGGRVTIGFEGRTGATYNIAIQRPLIPLHIVRATALLCAPLGFAPIGPMPEREEERLGISLPGAGNVIESKTEKPIVFINISGSHAEKYWGTENFIALARELQADGFYVRIGGSPGDAGNVHDIAGAANVESVPPRESLAAYVDELSRSDMVITPDTSIVHFAAALRKPVVVLNVGSAESTAPWQPWGVAFRVVSHPVRISATSTQSVIASARSLAREVGLYTQVQTEQAARPDA